MKIRKAPAGDGVVTVLIDGVPTSIRIGHIPEARRPLYQIGVADGSGEIDWHPATFESEDLALALVHTIAAALSRWP